MDKRCQVSALVLRAKPVLIEETDPDPYRAIDLAADRVARAVTRAIGRRRAARGVAAEARGRERTGLTPHLVPAR